MHKRKIRILMVEDEQILNDLCSQKLMQNGFEVTQVTDGDQALATIQQNRPDVVLLDIIMPVLNGFEVIEAIRNNPDEKIKKLPIVVLSNLGQTAEITKAFDLGANEYLLKTDFNPDEIISKINSLQLNIED